mgnify:CR=1 FL=1
MSYPTIEALDKKVILLSGFQCAEATDHPADATDVDVTDRHQLEVAMRRHRDAVAFAYLRGKWVPAA